MFALVFVLMFAPLSPAVMRTWANCDSSSWSSGPWMYSLYSSLKMWRTQLVWVKKNGMLVSQSHSISLNVFSSSLNSGISCRSLCSLWSSPPCAVAEERGRGGEGRRSLAAAARKTRNKYTRKGMAILCAQPPACRCQH